MASQPFFPWWRGKWSLSSGVLTGSLLLHRMSYGSVWLARDKGVQREDRRWGNLAFLGIGSWAEDCLPEGPLEIPNH